MKDYKIHINKQVSKKDLLVSAELIKSNKPTNGKGGIKKPKITLLDIMNRLDNMQNDINDLKTNVNTLQNNFNTVVKVNNLRTK
ncbi:MAG: hypothetical protein LBL60_01465 [Mycoplasmataceae bacterium]|jgi:hypothetical protein|nr:hypothetical protein [Mycoplasmataceae bacterium]